MTSGVVFFWISAILFAGLQFLPSRTRWSRIVPSFHFFAPTPLSWDVIIVSTYSDGSRCGLCYSDPPVRALAWNPERRIGKAMVDISRNLLCAGDKSGVLDGIVCFFSQNGDAPVCVDVLLRTMADGEATYQHVYRESLSDK